MFCVFVEQKISEKPQVIADYECGKAIPNNQVMGKIERAIGKHLVIVCIKVCCVHLITLTFNRFEAAWERNWAAAGGQIHEEMKTKPRKSALAEVTGDEHPVSSCIKK